MKDLYTLPDDLPVPVDDGACEHLWDAPLPSLGLAATQGGPVDLTTREGTVVAYCFPMLGRPDGPPMPGWNEIPGARGCTPQACRFRDEYAEFERRGARVFGISAQPLDEQREAAERLGLPYRLLCDSELRFARALDLPTFDYEGRTLIKRLTLVAQNGVVRKVFYPIFPPDRHASEVLAWLAARV